MTEAFDMAVVRSRIRDRMKQLKLKKHTVSMRAGLGPTAMRDILDYETSDIRVSTLVKIAEALETTIGELISGCPESSVDLSNASQPFQTKGDVHARLAKNMRRLRYGRKWSQEALAHEADLHRTYVSDLERGARNPSISAIDKLAKALGVSCGQLLD